MLVCFGVLARRKSAAVVMTWLAAACVVLLPTQTLAQGGYAIAHKIAIPGTGGWDYLSVDEGARRLYVSHGTQVEVADVDSGAIVGKIPNTPGVHGIAIASDLGRGFV